MIRPTVILLAIITLFSQAVIARGGPPNNIGNAAGLGQAPTSIPAMNDGLLNNPGLDTQLNTATTGIDKRGFELPLDNTDLAFIQASPSAFRFDHDEATLNAAASDNNTPALQTHAGAEQRGFAEPLMNPGLSDATTNTHAASEPGLDTANPAANDRRDNNQRVMARFTDLTTEDSIPAGIANRQAALGYEFDALASTKAEQNLDNKAYDPFADTAKGKAKKKKDATKEKQKKADDD